MQAIIYHIEAIRFVLKALFKGKMLFYFIPSIIICFIFYSLFGIFASIFKIFSFLEYIPWAGKFLVAGVTSFVSLLSFLWSQIMVFVILILLSPINTMVSAKTEYMLNGQKTTAGCAQFFNEMFRMVWLSLIAICLEFGLLFLIYIFSWFFPLGIVSIILTTTISSFFMGFAFFDYSLERHQINIGGSLGFAFKKPLYVLLSGAIFNLIYFIPFVGVVLAPIFVTMVSTVVFYQIKQKSKLNYDLIQTQ